MKIPLRKALELAVGPANVDAAGHAVADWFDGLSYLGATSAADRIREQLQDQPDQPAPAVPHNRPDTSLRAELMAKLATHREVILNLCERVDRLEMRADGLSPIERVERRWAKERSVKESLTVGGDGPAVSDDREPAAVATQPSDEEIMGLMPQQMHDDLATAVRAIAEQEGIDSTPAKGVLRFILNRHVVDLARAVLARWGHQPAPPAQRHPQPVPVSERLPGPEDCDGEGLCWVWNRTAYTWGVFRLDPTVHSHWLPANALPLPLPQQETPND